MKLWFDECLTPTLVQKANERGYWATCNRDRDLLGIPDAELHPLVIEEEAVFVTNNESDFVILSRKVDLHTGLVILPQVERREAAWPLLDVVLDYIEERAGGSAEPAADWMLNKFVEVEADGSVGHKDLP